MVYNQFFDGIIYKLTFGHIPTVASHQVSMDKDKMFALQIASLQDWVRSYRIKGIMTSVVDI